MQSIRLMGTNKVKGKLYSLAWYQQYHILTVTWSYIAKIQLGATLMLY